MRSSTVLLLVVIGAVFVQWTQACGGGGGKDSGGSGEDTGGKDAGGDQPVDEQCNSSKMKEAIDAVGTAI